MIRVGNHYRVWGKLYKITFRRKDYGMWYYVLSMVNDPNSRFSQYKNDIQHNLDKGFWVFVPKREVNEFMKNWDLL